MSKKKKKKVASPREKHSEDVINELLGEIEDEPDMEIEEDVAGLGAESEDDSDVKIAQPDEGKTKTTRLFFAAAVIILAFAVIGLVSSIRFVARGISDLADNTALKNEFTRFLLPVVANDIAPFEDESEISNASKVSCSIWNILIRRDTSAYKPSPAGGIYIPEYDIGVSCKEIFGANAELTHQSVGSGESRFVYDEENHVYSCPKDLRFLNYAPKITEMMSDGDDYTLRVDYMPPSLTMAETEDLGITVEADKTLLYTVNRKSKKNTLVSIRLISANEEASN